MRPHFLNFLGSLLAAGVDTTGQRTFQLASFPSLLRCPSLSDATSGHTPVRIESRDVGS